jgi:hypothetical protein
MLASEKASQQRNTRWRSYEYFAGVTPTLAVGPAVVHEATQNPIEMETKDFITIPLVVGRQAIFGALQLEGLRDSMNQI